jgi:hypothetical protein
VIEIKYSILLEKAKSFCEDGVSWHHHFLTPNCQFNKTNNFMIVLENENTGESWFSTFEEKPMKDLELLENLFFGRK